MKRTTAILLLLIILFSCNNKFPDYIKKDDGIYMNLLSFEEGNRRINKKGFAAVSIQVINKEKLLYKQYKEGIINLEVNKFSFLLKYLTVGDSCSFMVSTKKIITAFKPIKFTEKTSGFLEVVIKFHKYHVEESYDKEMAEQIVLKRYLEELKVKLQNGIYSKQLKKGEGEQIKTGDIITIAYKGYFVNRLMFDEISGATAFTFTYGTQGQVIKGLNRAIKTMREGEKSKIIIPSQLAFGEVGSTTGIVPPYTTVIYDLEIVKVN
ncbi:MAG: FKBP-type peptidyl-prolyl cis-trans isomerase [Flavobacteriales bacterium]|nr:FKBP-type peptidyl-prolyl cis-trans isomerase [Flavobacteriales bacterium]